MVGIRAHFDGSVIVPDEPVPLPPQAQVVVLADLAGGTASDDLERATQDYYRDLAETEGADEDSWGEGLARDSHHAWEE